MAEWLRRLGFDHYVPAFAENGITWPALMRLTDEDLKELGVGLLGHRKVMLYEIGKLTNPTSQIRVAPPPGAAIPPGSGVVRRISKPVSTQIPLAPPVRYPSAPIPVTANGAPPVAPVIGTASVPARPVRRGYWSRFGGSFLIVSIVLHILFGVGATYVVVQTIAKRKLSFQGGPPSPNPSQRALEHKVQMAKKRNTMSAPVQSKRILTTGLAKVALPSMPAMPKMDNETPARMAGMGGTGVGFGPAVGAMGNEGGTGSGGSVFSVFGMRDNRSNGLVGQFYDLKRNRNHQTNGMTPDQYAGELAKFVKGGWNDNFFDRYLKGYRKLYATQIFFPRIDSHEGPKAFGSDYAEPPGLWVALYKGQVSSPETGTYHFVAAGDDIMYIKFNGRLVLDQCLSGNKSGVNPLDSYKYPAFTYVNNGFAKSLPVSVTAGQYYDIEILIGDQIPLDTWAFVMIEKNGVSYKKDASGAPILPVFRLSGDKPRAPGSGGNASPPYQEDGPVWKGRAAASKPVP